MESNRSDEDEKNKEKIDDDLTAKLIEYVGFEIYLVLKRDKNSAEKVLKGLIRKKVSNDVFSAAAIFYQTRYHAAPINYLERYRNEVYSGEKKELSQNKSVNARTTLTSRLRRLIYDGCSIVYSVIK